MGPPRWLWRLVIGGIIVGIGTLAFIAYVWPGKSDPKVYAEIEGVKCESGERLDYHAHTTLEIVIDGDQQDIPVGVGVRTDQCHFWLHTHDDAPGRVHIEAPGEQDFTLGQFFAVWGQPLSSTQLLGATVGATQEIAATVDGEPVTGPPEDILLRDGETIVLMFREKS